MLVNCEMFVSDFFKLYTGHIALVGRINPSIDIFIPLSIADLYIGALKIKTINIIGEDMFSGGNEEKRRGIRSIRTDEDIANELNSDPGQPIKLIIYFKEKA